MSMHTCCICNKSSDIFAMPMVTEDGEPYNLHLCGTHWDVIYTLAKRASKTEEMEQRVSNLEAQVKALLDAVPSAGKRMK